MVSFSERSPRRMKVFKAKISYGILIPLLILFSGLMFSPMIKGASNGVILTMVAVMLPLLAFILHLFYKTTYSINANNELLIKSGFIFNLRIDIADITSITKISSLLSSPAPSLDRIELKYGKWDTVIISPQDKVAFTNALLKINPSIENNL
jgi:hypothetical protein